MTGDISFLPPIFPLHNEEKRLSLPEVRLLPDSRRDAISKLHMLKFNLSTQS